MKAAISESHTPPLYLKCIDNQYVTLLVTDCNVFETLIFLP